MPEHDVTDFYDAMANDYHLIFGDWVQAIERQSVVLNQIIRDYLPEQPMPIHVLDCSCGIGTQALGLAKQGYQVHATDISSSAVERARDEAQKMGLQLSFGVADMRMLTQTISEQYDVVLTFDNALPHLLTDDDLAQAAHELFTTTRPGGIFMASIRDYDSLLTERPQMTSQHVVDSPDGKRVMFQVWDWDDEHYTFTQFFLIHQDDDWQMHHYTSRYRALRRDTLSNALATAGFHAMQWLMPAESGFYQPIVVARR